MAPYDIGTVTMTLVSYNSILVLQTETGDTEIPIIPKYRSI